MEERDSLLEQVESREETVGDHLPKIGLNSKDDVVSINSLMKGSVPGSNSQRSLASSTTKNRRKKKKKKRTLDPLEEENEGVVELDKTEIMKLKLYKD